ncbi:hypothetical protein EGR_10340 [Echinococcus granulosus]|uniref:Uncharacterized protein n=1 Tax=Echinococcus granulosus TaxID=6210 RepID=W6U2M9_ECHGR|nr:hypothetical protein EGR_10340 [Echinococcus granulosus]EUB54811.1 hypothetical protein EGR_10340 [Echinococcus granulosus]
MVLYLFHPNYTENVVPYHDGILQIQNGQDITFCKGNAVTVKSSNFLLNDDFIFERWERYEVKCSVAEQVALSTVIGHPPDFMVLYLFHPNYTENVVPYHDGILQIQNGQDITFCKGNAVTVKSSNFLLNDDFIFTSFREEATKIWARKIASAFGMIGMIMRNVNKTDLSTATSFSVMQIFLMMPLLK